MLLTVQIQPGPSRNEAPFESPLARLCPVVRSLKKHVPVVESRPAAFCSGDLPERAIEIDHSHAGFPQGLFDATNLISLPIRFVASWLTNAIDRIVKERPPELAEPGANSTRALSDSNRPDLVMIYRHHRPVQACPLAARPGRCLRESCEAVIILTRRSSRLKPLHNNFWDRSRGDPAHMSVVDHRVGQPETLAGIQRKKAAASL